MHLGKPLAHGFAQDTDDEPGIEDVVQAMSVSAQAAAPSDEAPDVVVTSGTPS